MSICVRVVCLCFRVFLFSSFCLLTLTHRVDTAPLPPRMHKSLMNELAPRQSLHLCWEWPSAVRTHPRNCRHGPCQQNQQVFSEGRYAREKRIFNEGRQRIPFCFFDIESLAHHFLAILLCCATARKLFGLFKTPPRLQLEWFSFHAFRVLNKSVQKDISCILGQ